MDFILDTSIMWAIVICAAFGSAIFIISSALSGFCKQKKDAEEIKNRIAASGRDPENPSVLTPAERWEIEKAARFDRTFLVTDAIAIIVGAGIAFGIVYGWGPGTIQEDWVHYGFASFFAGLLGAFLADRTITKNVAAGKWDEKAAEFFQDIRSDGSVEEKVAALIAKGVPADVARMAVEALSKKKR